MRGAGPWSSAGSTHQIPRRKGGAMLHAPPSIFPPRAVRAHEPRAGRMDSMNESGLDLKDIIAVLARTPASLTALLEGLPDVWVNATEGGSTWSPYDVVADIVHAERAHSVSSPASR